VYSDDVSLFGGNINIIQRVSEFMLASNEAVGLEIDAEKINIY
jgi:hypothetical protein